MCLDQLNGKTLDMWDCKTGATAANQQFAYNNTLSGIVVGDSTATRQCLTATASGGGGAEATLFGKVAFLSNMDDFAGAAVTYAGNSYYLPNHTVAIVRPSTGEVVFNSSQFADSPAGSVAKTTRMLVASPRTSEWTVYQEQVGAGTSFWWCFWYNVFLLCTCPQCIT
jgi:hypothetical protein